MKLFLILLLAGVLLQTTLAKPLQSFHQSDDEWDDDEEDVDIMEDLQPISRFSIGSTIIQESESDEEEMEDEHQENFRTNIYSGEDSSDEFVSEVESDDDEYSNGRNLTAESYSESEQSDGEEEDEDVRNGVEEESNESDSDDFEFSEIDYFSRKEESNPITSKLENWDDEGIEGSSDDDFDADADEEKNIFERKISDENEAEGHQDEQDEQSEDEMDQNDEEFDDEGFGQEDNENYEKEADEDLLKESSPENSASISPINLAQDEKTQENQNTINQEDDIKDSDLLEDDDEDLIAEDNHDTTTIQDNLSGKDNAPEIIQSLSNSEDIIPEIGKKIEDEHLLEDTRSYSTNSTELSAQQTIPTSIPSPIPLSQLALPSLLNQVKQTTPAASSSSPTPSSTAPSEFTQSDENSTPEPKFQPIFNFYKSLPSKMPFTIGIPPSPLANPSSQESVSSVGNIEQASQESKGPKSNEVDSAGKLSSSSQTTPSTVPRSNSFKSAQTFTPSFLNRNRPSFAYLRGSGN